MKKLAVFLLLSLLLSPVFATSFKVGFETNAGFELFTGENTVPQFAAGADAQLPIIVLDETSSLSFPLRFQYVSDFITVKRYTTTQSMKAGFGIRYMYKIKDSWKLGIGATGGLWGFDTSLHDIHTTVYHSLEARVEYDFAKHFSVCIPLCFTSASFGNNINLSVSLNIH